MDFERYVSDLRELKEALGIKVYAYCLMTNHVHLLLAPGESTSSLGQLMKALAGRMTRYRNKVEGRTGTLWESRYKSSVVQSDTYLLACGRYIELNPVRAGMVARAEDYRWSSFALRLCDFSESTWLDKDPCFLELGPTDAIESKGTDLFSAHPHAKYQHKNPQPHLIEITVFNTDSEQPNSEQS
jgi:putative transposase